MREVPSLQLSEEEFQKQYEDVPEKNKELWEVELELMDVLDRVCKKHNLTWFADGGTLLGAVRHRGFIPWDDDIDVQMFAEDYQKLCSVAKEEFHEPYFLQTWETEEDYFPFMGKLRKSGTYAYTQYEAKSGSNWNRGVFIDIFPLYYIPENSIKRKTQLLLLKIFRAAMHGYEAKKSGLVVANTKLLSNCFVLFYNVISLCLNYRQLSSLYLKVAGWQKQPTNKIGVLSFNPGKKELTWDTEWFKKTVDLQFMDRKVPAPYEWDKRLKVQYGDYMTPVKNHGRHGILITDERDQL